MIQSGRMTPRETILLGVALLAAGSLVGLILAWLTGPLLIAIGVVGLLSGVFYSARPLFLAARGLGELLVGLNFGVLTVAGSYFVQTGALWSGESGYRLLFVSLPVAFLIVALVYINEFPDYEADRIAGKQNLVVRLGPKLGRWGIIPILAGSYLSLILGTAFGFLPPLSLIALISLLFTIPAATGLISNYMAGPELVPSIRRIIHAHFATGALLLAVFLL